MRLRELSLKKQIANADGFTLIETLIGLFVFTVGVLGVMALVVTSINGYTRSRTSNVEVNATALNLEVLKHVDYGNSNLFSGAGGTTKVQGSAGGNMDYADTNNAVVMDTKFIAMTNTKIKGTGQSTNFSLFWIKAKRDK